MLQQGNNTKSIFVNAVMSLVICVFFSLTTFSQFSFAEGGGNGGDCSQCQKGGSGGGGGAQAADILMGIAAMMAAISPMVATSIEASANKDIAKINTKAQIEMSQISAKSTQFLAEQQRGIALSNAQTAQEIAATNQQATTQRLSQQLTSLDTARKDANGQEDKRTFYEQQLNNERIAIAKQQMQQSTDLANTQFRAQLTAQGLSSGFANSIDSSNGIKVNRGLGTGRGEAASAVASNNLGSALVPRSPTSAMLSDKPVTSAANRTPVTAAVGLPMNTTARGISNSQTNRLLSSLNLALLNNAGAGKLSGNAKTRGIKAATAKTGSSLPTGLVTLDASSVGKALSSAMILQGMVRGSTATERLRIRIGEITKPNDLDRFMVKTLGTDGSAPTPHRAPASVSDQHNLKRGGF